MIGKGKPKIGALAYKRNINMKNYPNILKAKRKLKWHPLISINEGLKKTILSFE